MIIPLKYGTADVVQGIPLMEAGTPDYKVNPTLAAGDVKISKDGGALANLATLPAVTPAGSTDVKITVSVAETQCKQGVITFIDQTSPKEWENNRIIFHTFGHASAQHEFDLDSNLVTAIFAKTGITAGGTWTLAKILKVLTAWATGKWQDKSGSPGTYEILDPDDGTTVIAEITPSATTPQKQVTIL